MAEASFTDLRDIVRELAQAQLRTEARVEELAQAQVRTEARLDSLTQRMEELAQAQARTEARLDSLTQRMEELAQAQARTEARLDSLTQRMEELAQAQARTEARLDSLTQRVEELAQAQLRTENEVTRLRRTLETQLGGLGARWGIQTEEAFRNAMKTILEEVGFRTERYLTYDTEGEVFGRPDQVELDVVIHDGKVIVVEIKSSLDREHVHLFSRKVAFYARKTGRQVARQVIVTPFTERGARELAEVLKVEICTDVSAFK